MAKSELSYLNVEDNLKFITSCKWVIFSICRSGTAYIDLSSPIFSYWRHSIFSINHCEICRRKIAFDLCRHYIAITTIRLHAIACRLFCQLILRARVACRRAQYEFILRARAVWVDKKRRHAIACNRMVVIAM